MARWKKTLISEKKKVIKAKLLEPNKSLRDISKETGVNHQTASDIIKEIPNILTKSDNDIIKDIDSIIEDITNITKKFLKWVDPLEIKSKDVKALTDVMKINFERKQILTWKPTEIKDISINLEWKSIQEIEEIKERLLN